MKDLIWEFFWTDPHNFDFWGVDILQSKGYKSWSFVCLSIFPSILFFFLHPWNNRHLYNVRTLYKCLLFQGCCLYPVYLVLDGIVCFIEKLLCRVSLILFCSWLFLVFSINMLCFLFNIPLFGSCWSHFLSEFVESLDCSAQIGYQPLLSLVICWVNPNKKSTMASRNNFAVLKHNYALTSQVSLNSLLSTLYHH